MEQIFQLKFTTKQLSRQARKAEKEQIGRVVGVAPVEREDRREDGANGYFAMAASAEDTASDTSE